MIQIPALRPNSVSHLPPDSILRSINATKHCRFNHQLRPDKSSDYYKLLASNLVEPYYYLSLKFRLPTFSKSQLVLSALTAPGIRAHVSEGGVGNYCKRPSLGVAYATFFCIHSSWLWHDGSDPYYCDFSLSHFIAS